VTLAWLMALLAIASEAFPLLAVIALRRRVRGARLWVVAWCTFLLAWDLTSLCVSWHGHSNLWLTYVLEPVGIALVLWSLSLWQLRELPRLTMRFALVPFVVAWVVLTVAFEDTSGFSRAADPMAALLGLGAAAYTLLARAGRSRGDLLRCDWLWVCGGMALYFGTGTALQPLAALLIAQDPQLVVLAYDAKAALDVAAFLAIARGVTCPTGT